MTRPSPSFAALAGASMTLLPQWAWAQQSSPDLDRYGWGPHMMGWGGWSGMIFGPFFMVLVLALVVVIAVLIVRRLGTPWQVAAPHQPPATGTPVDILRERFARGEIDKDEYEERRRILGG